jgi:hypothetical protein
VNRIDLDEGGGEIIQLIMHPYTDSHTATLDQKLDQLSINTTSSSSSGRAPENNSLAATISATGGQGGDAMLFRKDQTQLEQNSTAQGTAAQGNSGPLAAYCKIAASTVKPTGPGSDDLCPRKSAGLVQEGWNAADGWSVFPVGSGLPRYVQLRVYQIQQGKEVSGLEEFMAQGEGGLRSLVVEE